MSLHPKKVMGSVALALAVIVPLTIGGTAALAAEAPTGAPVSSDASNSDTTAGSATTATATPAPAAPAADPAPAATTDSTKQEATPAPSTPTPAPTPVVPEPTPAPVASPAPVPTAPATPAAAVTPAPAVVPQAAAATQPSKPVTPKKVFVCKYVGTPHVDERLQTGDNPISVSVSAIQNNQWDGSVPGWFSDAHERSYVLAYDTGQPKPDVSACPQPVGPTCVDASKVAYTHTFDGTPTSRTLTITASGGETGELICGDGRYASLALYAFMKANNLWPQQLMDVFYMHIDKIGTYTYSFNVTCGQIDGYMGDTLNSVIPAAVLYGSHNPYEPDFVSQHSKGPNTYYATSPYGCSGIPADKVEKVELPKFECGDTEVTVTTTITTTPYKLVYEDGVVKAVLDTDNAVVTTSTSTRPPTPAELATCPTTETGTATFTVQTCDVESRNWISAEAVPGGIWSISDGKGHTQDLAGIGESYEGGLPDGFSYGPTYTVSLRDGNSEDLYNVTPWSGTWTPVDASTECQPKVAYAHASMATQATCDANSTTEFTIEHATWQTPAETKPGDWVRVAIADEGYVFPTMSEKGSTTEEVLYTIKGALGHQSTDANAPCYVKPPETTPPPTIVTAEQPPTSQSPVLAQTGSSISMWTGILGVVLTVAGLLATLGVIVFRRRREAASDNE